QQRVPALDAPRPAGQGAADDRLVLPQPLVALVEADLVCLRLVVEAAQERVAEHQVVVDLQGVAHDDLEVAEPVAGPVELRLQVVTGATWVGCADLDRGAAALDRYLLPLRLSLDA